MNEQKEISRIQALEDELDKYRLESVVLREVSSLVGSASELQVVYDRVAERAREFLNAETALIPIINHESGEYTYIASSGSNADELLGETLPLSIGMCGWVLRNNQPWWSGVLDSLDEDERNRWEKKAGTLILVPLIGKSNLFGGIACINKIGEPEFSKQDLDLLELFASQVSIAIENAIFFHEMKKAREAEEIFRQELEETNERLTTANKNLGYLAVHDPLTGLPNRTLINDRLEQGIKSTRREKQTLALIVIDLNHFKEINDTLGHAIGDQLLIAIGERFNGILRDSDTLGRLGGDEFAIVLPTVQIQEAIQVANKVSGSLNEPVTIEEHQFAVSASVGIAMYPEHGTTSSILMKNADIAMYSAKHACEKYAFYSQFDDCHSTDRLSLLTDLRIAVESNALDIAMQPKVNMNTGLIEGFEALARWTHPVHGFVGPDVFVPLIENLGLIKQFTLMILEKSLVECLRLRMAGYDVGVAVNISTRNLKDISLTEDIAELMGRYRIKSQTLTIEITETAVMSDTDNSLRVLSELEEMGIRLSVDDYGTGYSSLSYLKSLPVHELKIDRMFIRDMIVDTDNALIVKSTIELAHNLGLVTVAEGIENMATFDALRNLGSDSAQGYEICRPLAPDAIIEFLENSRWPCKQFSAVGQTAYEAS